MQTDPSAWQRIYQQLATFYGYNIYDRKETVRLNDQLVRQRIGDALSRLKARLRQSQGRIDLAHQWSRESTGPAPEAVTRYRDFDRLSRRLDQLQATLANAPLPNYDLIWLRFSTHEAAVQRVLEIDLQITENLSAVESSTSEPLDFNAVEGALDSLETTAARREAALSPVD